MEDDVSVDDGQDAVSDGGCDHLEIEISKVLQDKMQQFIGIRLLQLELSNESDLKRKSSDFQLLSFILLQILSLHVALHSQTNEILNSIRYQRRQ